MEPRRRAGAYLRISMDREGNRLGVDRQEPPVRALCARLGWEVIEIYVDDDLSISEAGRRRRPNKRLDEYERMLADAATGRINAVATLDYTRLMRHPKDAEKLIDFANTHNVEMATAAGPIDLSTATGRMQFRMLAAIGAHEVELKAERHKRKHDQLAAAGKDAGGTRSFGRGADRVTLDPIEAEIIKEAAERLLRGEKLSRYTAELIEAGIPTAHGGRWHPTTLKRVLIAPRTAGLREHNGIIVGEAEWPPILDRPTWEAVRAILLDPDRSKGGRPADYLLTGLVVHGGVDWCKAALLGNTHRGVRNYECKKGLNHRGCGRLGVRAEWLENLIVDAVLEHLAGPKFRNALAEGRAAANDPRLAELREQAKHLEARPAQLKDMLDDGTLDQGGYERAMARIEQRLAATRQQLAAARGRPVLEGLPTDRPGLDRWWGDEQTGIDRKRALLREALVRIEVKAGRKGRYDSSRVLPDGLIWRV